MIRFTMPEAALPQEERKALLKEQFDAFLRADALQELCSVLETDLADLPEQFSKRQKPSGSVMETQDLAAMPELTNCRERLFPLFRELGFIDINVPCRGDHTRIMLYGGALGACFDRARHAAQFLTEQTESVDALTCYRPINPVERGRIDIASTADTEFGALTEALAKTYGLADGTWEDSFSGDRNLNAIACCRTYRGETGGRTFRVLAAPSSDPQVRRADTGDCIAYYLQQTEPQEGDSMLAITNSRYCNRQFIQTAYQLIQCGCRAEFDIIGCHPKGRAATADTYDPLQYLQDLIGMLDWIGKFRQL